MSDLTAHLPPTRTLLSELRRVTGIVIFCFVAMHLTNHALLLVSVDLAERMRAVFVGPWKTIPGEVLLYGSLLFHAVTALWTLYARRSLMMPPREMLQFVFGLLIPYLLIDHVVSAGVGRMVYGWATDYRTLLHTMWADNAALGIQQATAVIVVWTHGCIGIANALAGRAGARRWAVPALIAAAVLPALALVGFVVIGRWVAFHGGANDAVLHSVQTQVMAEDHTKTLAMISTYLRGAYIVMLGTVLVLRQVRAVWQHATGIEITYKSGDHIHVATGTTILEASRIAGIPHYSVCGGNGRCSTCRVRILATEGALPPPGDVERATLARIGAAPDVRLACQLRPTHDLMVERVLMPTDQSPHGTGTENPPEERLIAVLFCDLRGFTTFSEQHMPYDVVFLLNRYFQVVGDAVESCGGKVDKFIGDGAMAVFGMGGDFDTACRDAMRAAAMIRRNVAQLGHDLKQDDDFSLNAVVGVHAGPAIIGKMGVPGAIATTAVGDTVNVASRLETIAKQESVAIVASGEIVAHSGFDLGAPGLAGVESRTVRIRGRKEKMKIYLIDDRGTPRLD